MITLDGVTLNPSMIWQERFTSQTVQQSVRRTLGGLPVVFSGQLTKGEEITLVADSDIGWLKKSVVDQLLTKAAVPGAQYVLGFNGQNINVIFRHNDPPAVDMTPIFPREAQGDDDYMRGSIKLLTV